MLFYDEEYIQTVSERHIELYQNIGEEKFVKVHVSNIYDQIETNIMLIVKNYRIL